MMKITEFLNRRRDFFVLGSRLRRTISAVKARCLAFHPPGEKRSGPSADLLLDT